MNTKNLLTKYKTFILLGLLTEWDTHYLHTNLMQWLIFLTALFSMTNQCEQGSDFLDHTTSEVSQEAVQPHIKDLRHLVFMSRLKTRTCIGLPVSVNISGSYFSSLLVVANLLKVKLIWPFLLSQSHNVVNHQCIPRFLIYFHKRIFKY